MIKLTDKQIDKITALCEKWSDCVPVDMSNEELMMAISSFIGMWLSSGVEDMATINEVLDELSVNVINIYIETNKRIKK
jgi:hypothetical protein